MRVNREPVCKYNSTVAKTFTSWGIFTQIEQMYEYDFPLIMPDTWVGSAGSFLDHEFLKLYGSKNLSPMAASYLNDAETYVYADGAYAGAAVKDIACYVFESCHFKWDKMIAIMNTNYDPIHNYLDEWEDESDRDKTGSNSFTSTRQDTLNTTETTQSTRTDNLLSTKTINESESTTDTQTDGIFGFNSSTSSNADKSDGSSSKTTIGTDTDANTGTQGLSQTVADTGTNTRGTQEASSETENEDIARSGRHSGNIGNITTQKMIREEFELWQWNFVEQVLKDTANIVTSYVYLSDWEFPDPPYRDHA